MTSMRLLVFLKHLCLYFKYLNSKKKQKIKSKTDKWTTAFYKQDLRLALPIIGTEEASTFLSQGFPNLCSSGLHHLGFYGFFWRVRHNGFIAADTREKYNSLTTRSAGLTSATSVATRSSGKVHVPTPANTSQRNSCKRLIHGNWGGLNQVNGVASISLLAVSNVNPVSRSPAAAVLNVTSDHFSSNMIVPMAQVRVYSRVSLASPTSWPPTIENTINWFARATCS